MKFAICSLLTVAAIAQPPLSPETRKAVVDGAARAIESNYVFPDVGKKMAEAVRSKAAAGAYDSITAPPDLAAKLTDDLRAVQNDKHLRVRFGAPQGGGPGPAPAASNFGFTKAEILDGNIGYFDLRGFAGVREAGPVAGAVMTMLANTDALIIDLRNNGGGQPEMVAYLCSYFFEKPLHVNTIYWRPTDTTKEHWTTAEVTGRKFLAKPVWVLTSQRTFSGGEEFAYDLKALKRATLVGETTGGGAHPVTVSPLEGGFSISVPAGRAINPVTKTNWEGTGVEPDVKVAAADALKVAHEAALKVVRPGADAPVITELPKTPAGRALGAFVTAINTGQVEEMRKFHRDRGGPEDNGDRDLGFYQQSGGLEIVKIAASREDEISAVVRFKKNGNQAHFTMSVETAPPHGITGIRIRPN